MKKSLLKNTIYYNLNVNNHLFIIVNIIIIIFCHILKKFYCNSKEKSQNGINQS